MATPITNIPQGFLSLTGLRDMGGVPREVVPTITPGIDITQFLLLNREAVDGAVSYTGLISAVGLEVPAGELWYVHFVTAITAVMAAGETIQIQAGYKLGAINVSISDPVRATAGHRCSAYARDFWLPAGAALTGRVMEFTSAGTITGSVAAIITRLRI